MSKYIYAEFKRCIQCQACEVACRREHDGQSNVNIVVVQDRFSVPIACRHCYTPSCSIVCPHDALKSDGAQVKFDPDKCTGCRLCELACPFGAMGFNSISLKAAKCDLCEKRRSNGREPACYMTCPSRALEYDIYQSHGALKKRRAVALRAGQPPKKGGLI